MQCCNDETKECACQENCESDDYSNILDPGKFVILSVVSGGAYFIYWFYRNWKHLKEHTNGSLRPVARTIGAIFPIVDIILYCVQFTAIHRLAKKEGRRAFPLVWVCVGFSLTIVAAWLLFAATFRFLDPGVQFDIQFFGLIITVFAALIALPVQLSLNDIWKHAHKTKPVRLWYTNGEKAWIVVGALLMFFSFISIFMASPSPLEDSYPPDFYQDNQSPAVPQLDEQDNSGS